MAQLTAREHSNCGHGRCCAAFYLPCALLCCAEYVYVLLHMHDLAYCAPVLRPTVRCTAAVHEPPLTNRLFAGLSGLGAAMTYLTYTSWGPWLCSNVPGLGNYMDVAPYVNAPIFIGAGIAHFVTHQEFCKFYPHQVRRPGKAVNCVEAGTYAPGLVLLQRTVAPVELGQH